MAHACRVNVFWLAGGWTAELHVHSSSLCCRSNTPLFACHLRTLDWQSAELVLNLQSGSRSSRRVDKRLLASVLYGLSVKQTQGTTTSVWGGKTNWEHFFWGVVWRMLLYMLLQLTTCLTCLTSHLSTDRGDNRPAYHHHRGDIRQSNVGPRVGHPPHLTAGQRRGWSPLLDYTMRARYRLMAGDYLLQP